MIIFQCDTCGAQKKTNETWILGFAAQNIGLTAARRELTIASAWDDTGALDWLAVHFCSDECRAEYMEKIFHGAPNTLTGEKTAVIRRTKKMVPGGSVETLISEKAKPTIDKRAHSGEKSKTA